ncbi:MAG: cupin domain-containing protein [Chloroflexota bacterium]
MDDHLTESPGRRAIVRGPGEGTILVGSGGTPTVIKLHGDESGGAYSFLEIDVAPGPGARPHVHHRADEAFYVAEGELTLVLEDREVCAPAGSFVLVPRGTRHTFRNQTSAPAKAVFIVSPPGFERFFEELTERRTNAPRGELSPETIAEIGRKYDTEFR